ncbi:hypothetical protein MYSTI_02415 [Myxococcus stipitatus DSM 14675]|uniref:DUF3291 domain-containing protein n=1 Tax=Myxococcus stipitatus (strain DSM 14675 / JCM 12634 / Mx s8) TaxID=1278073 RepID=L7U4I3_MYXSD|nr:DUF3291 domain-containing protein [Myxococcus stipitatus]AGC43731.1 hypothetical protein MYSTI_02415 [Myxococcus stipitatus DSM 14675]
MTTPRYQVAQLAISLAREPLDHPLMQDFVAQLRPVNELADRSPGFVWRLQTDAGNATGVRGYDNPLILLNMSTWESVETLFDFVYRSEHVVPFRERRKWFLPVEGPPYVLWWVPAGHQPTVLEAKERLERLQREGPSPEAFDFRHRFPSPDQLTLPAAAQSPQKTDAA